MILPKLSTHFVFYFMETIYYNMRIGIITTAGGMIILAFGVLFFLQGISIVGPKSSFMYSNPKWITYGGYIAIAGAIITVTGIVTSLRRPKS